MMILAIALIATTPVVGQILMQYPDLREHVYPFSWTMYSR